MCSIVFGNRPTALPNLCEMLQIRRNQESTTSREVQEGLCDPDGARERKHPASRDGQPHGAHVLQGNRKSGSKANQLYTNLDQMTTSVSSSICVKKGNTCVASFLETDPRPCQICVRCYKSDEIKGLQPLEKYKKAYVTLTAHVNENSQLHEMVNRMVHMYYKEMENQGTWQTSYTRT